MPAPSKLISLLPVFVAPSSQLKIEYSDKIEAFQFLSNNPGHKLLHNRSKRSNAGYFEEFSPPSLKDECIDEVCSQEEMSEIVGGKPAEKENLKNSLSKSCTYGGTSLSDLLKEDAEQRAKREACDTRRTLKCIQKWAEHSCECLPGWKGSGCKEMEDFCADNKAADNTPLCPQGYQCVNQPRSGRNPENSSDDIGFICKLKPGFATDDVDSSNLIKKIYNIKRLRGLETEDVQVEKSYPFASDIDECLDPANNVCGQLENRQCKNVDSGYYCECITGFRDKLTSAQIESLTPEEITAMNGHPDQEYSSCDDIDECKERPNICENTENSHCTNTIGSFTCDCDSGFDIKNGGAGDTGKVCEDINECEVHNIADNYNCLQCANEIPGEYEVTCNYGQAKQLSTDDGSLEWECVDVDECAENKSKCPLHSKCVNLESMPDQCGIGRESFLNNESPWWGYGLGFCKSTRIFEFC